MIAGNLKMEYCWRFAHKLYKKQQWQTLPTLFWHIKKFIFSTSNFKMEVGMISVKIWSKLPTSNISAIIQNGCLLLLISLSDATIVWLMIGIDTDAARYFYMNQKDRYIQKMSQITDCPKLPTFALPSAALAVCCGGGSASVHAGIHPPGLDTLPWPDPPTPLGLGLDTPLWTDRHV